MFRNLSKSLLFLCFVLFTFISIGAAFATWQYADANIVNEVQDAPLLYIESWWGFSGEIESNPDVGEDYVLFMDEIESALNDSSSVLNSAISTRVRGSFDDVSNVEGTAGGDISDEYASYVDSITFLIDYSDVTFSGNWWNGYKASGGTYYIYYCDSTELEVANEGDYIFTYRQTVVYQNGAWVETTCETGYSLVGTYIYNVILQNKEKCITSTWMNEEEYARYLDSLS